MSRRLKWEVWTLHLEDIHQTAKGMGIEPKSLSKADCDDIARRFIEGFGWAMEDWKDILQEAIRDSKGRPGTSAGPVDEPGGEAQPQGAPAALAEAGP